ncbi:uncharacterized protein LOC124117556 isoform X1 [Haliotis rufescens]|uniref:uncharacterized protein LOC124117556 isoform X1 n=1 Tax=Haliotis rufescens TaxID=6454 RepID=UPI00201F9055|nr:uncharacterized protein LOC124117556 isoform X1 [Haliotis rufescens]
MEILTRGFVLAMLCVLSSAPVLSIMHGICPMFMCFKSCPMGYKRDMMGCKMCDCMHFFGNSGFGNSGFGNSGFGIGMGNMNFGFSSSFSSFQLGSSGFLSVSCPFGIPKVFCPISPCLNVKCHMYPMATCVESYCGGCHAAFYLHKKKIFC